MKHTDIRLEIRMVPTCDHLLSFVVAIIVSLKAGHFTPLQISLFQSHCL